MNPMIQIKTTRKGLASFVEKISLMGYYPVDVNGNIHFTHNGETTINYSGYRSPVGSRQSCYIGVRPEFIL